MTQRRTPVTEVLSGSSSKPVRHTLTEAQVKAIATQAAETVKQLLVERQRDARVDRVIKATQSVLAEAAAMPLHERPEEERRRIESDLWTLAEAMRERQRRSPFWDGLTAA